jgi:hypothetical protein
MVLTQESWKNLYNNSADTWEKKHLTFPGDTTGALDNDNSSELYKYN